ncbi:hypothetical protein V495_01922 [Pseudogymnoascus sp. VKM F-4514 (FW-929)]|nr:hypothetical protein V495_01922 [Pseudogymnoascus sp. VKM F-4514 (FW-929)]KFY56705.1 hypothetical protein V497_06042 [Pseudogymnoascus sp. VKM F-4516 (FW-969)]
MDLKRSDFAVRPQEHPLPPDWHFGKLSEVIERGDYCNFCKMIAESVSTTAYEHEVEVLGCWIPDVTYTDEDTEDGVKTEMITLRLRILPETSAWKEAFKPFDIIPLAQDSEEGMFLGRRVDPNSLDIPLMKTWLQKCEEWHEIVCWKKDLSRSRREGPVTIEFPFRPFIRLLDLKDDCIIETSATPVFVALSYVWGHVTMHKTLKKTLQDLMQHGSLTKNFDLFPATIQDAITLTRLLDHRYLWIDSICILQDDDLDKSTQVQHMDAIFTRSSFTIVAANGGNANTGLTGLQGAPRDVTQHTATYSNELSLLSLIHNLDDTVDTSIWNSRCWTYQERVLSRRMLVFTKDSIYFDCGHVTWSEDINRLSPLLYTSADSLVIVPSRGEEPPTVTGEYTYALGVAHEHYFRMINEYTSRDMTYPNDRLSGFQGVLNFFNLKYGPRFIWGMWSEKMLVHSLLWQPEQYLARIPIDENTNAPIYPSWSWAGWSGAVKYYNHVDWNGLPALKDPWKRAVPSEYGEKVEIMRDDAGLDESQVAMYHLQLHTRTANFRLTLEDSKMKSLTKDHGGHPIRFGITAVRPSALGADEEWLGTILLPASYQHKISEEHEFIVLSSAYCFVSDELPLDISSTLEPYAAINVMLITRESTALYDGRPVVVRAGVGRMLKKAWDTAEVRWEDMIVA